MNLSQICIPRPLVSDIILFIQKKYFFISRLGSVRSVFINVNYMNVNYYCFELKN